MDAGHHFSIFGCLTLESCILLQYGTSRSVDSILGFKDVVNDSARFWGLGYFGEGVGILVGWNYICCDWVIGHHDLQYSDYRKNLCSNSVNVAAPSIHLSILHTYGTLNAEVAIDYFWQFWYSGNLMKLGKIISRQAYKPPHMKTGNFILSRYYEKNVTWSKVFQLKWGCHFVMSVESFLVISTRSGQFCTVCSISIVKSVSRWNGNDWKPGPSSHVERKGWYLSSTDALDHFRVLLLRRLLVSIYLSGYY